MFCQRLFTRYGDMKMKKLSLVMVGVWVVLFFVFGPLHWLGGGVVHPWHIGYGASDSFQHSERLDWIVDHGYSFEAPWMSAGYTDVISFYPPLFYGVAKVLVFAGLPYWDAAILLPFLCVIVSGVLMFFIVRRYDPVLAVLSVPFFFFVLTWDIFFGFSWGHWPAFMGQMFFMLMLFALTRKVDELKCKWIYWRFLLVAVSFLGMILSHTPAAVFGGVVFGAWWVWFAFNNWKKSKYLVCIYFLVPFLSAVACIEYLFKFVNTWLVFQKPEIVSGWGNPLFSIGGFGDLFGYVLIPLGIFILVWCTVKKKENVHVLCFVLLAALLGFGNWYFLSWRAFQFRFLWPLLFAPFMAFPLKWCFDHLDKLKFRWVWVKKYVVVLFAVGLCFGFINSNLVEDTTDEFMTGEMWDLFGFVRGTPEDSLFYYFGAEQSYFSQAAVFFVGRRVHSRLEPLDFFDYVAGVKNFSRVVPSRVGGDRATYFPHLVNGSVSFYLDVDNYDAFDGPMDLCGFDYWVFDVYGEVFARVLFVGNEVVFSNSDFLVIRNVGGGICV